jgi:hypothetical protein
MTTAIALIVLVALAAFGFRAIVTFVSHDGYGRPTPPRSHVPDAFESHRLA